MTTTRYRCGGCGNLTRFTVIATTRTSSYHHFTLGGELGIEDVEVLAKKIDSVVCRICGQDKNIQVIDALVQPDASPQ